jgi:hypothetical protein
MKDLLKRNIIKNFNNFSNEDLEDFKKEINSILVWRPKKIFKKVTK